MKTAVSLKLLSCFILSAFFMSCTSARWTVKDKEAVDRSEEKIVQEEHFLSPDGNLSPEIPVLRLNLLSEVHYEYPQRVLLHRNIQDYRLRPGFVALGLAGASVAFYVANSNSLGRNNSSARSLTLNTTGALLAVSAFLNMKPVGEPRPTGEERHLRSTGTITEIDTVEVTGNSPHKADITVAHEGRTIIEEQGREISGALELELANILDGLRLSGNNPGSVNVNVNFNDSTYAYSYPVQAILLPYAQITAPVTNLRSAPEETPSTVLAELLKGSQLQIEKIEDEQWYRVLYGISENFILRSDSRLIWRPSGFTDNNSVVTVSQIPFGNIDVENNIPILRETKENAFALIITNEEYTGKYSARSYSHRDGRLLKTYLEDALGYPSGNIYELRDIRNSEEITGLIQNLKEEANDSSEVFIYINGHGQVENVDNSYRLKLSSVDAGDDSETNGLNLRAFYEQLSKIPSGPMLVLNDIGFGPENEYLNLSRSENRQIFTSNFSVLTNTNPDAAIITGTNIDQSSGLYLSGAGEDKKHHIFPYFFARALQQRLTGIPEIYQYLERNVPYTSRRLHDRSQDPMLLGSTSLDFISE